MTKARKLTIVQHIDPCHSWYAVPRPVIDALGITDRITIHSYEGPDGTLYLEEDEDGPLFLDAAREAGYDLRFTLFGTDGPSPVRRLPRTMWGSL